MDIITWARNLVLVLPRWESGRSNKCELCAELGIPGLLATIKHSKGSKRQKSLSIIFIRCLLIMDGDNLQESACSSCQACVELELESRENNINDVLTKLMASKIWSRGEGILSGFRQKKSWFLLRDEWLIRCTGLGGSYRHSVNALVGERNRHDNRECLEQEYFGMVSIAWSPLSLSREGYVYRVSRRLNYFWINAWLHCCTNSSQGHAQCLLQNTLDLHSITLIDVKSRRLVPYTLAKAEGGDYEYLALSYVWGNSRQEAVQKSMPLPKKLPQTIQDALTIVTELGKRYLWVDSICIDASEPAEKMNQILIMDQIYQGAYATLIALSGNNADSGIPGVRYRSTRIPQMYADFGKIHMAARMPDLEQELEKSKWMERAWTYQEALLSRRCIIFTENQVFFSCNVMGCSESMGRLETPGLKLHPLRDPLVHFGQLDWSAKEYPELQVYNHFIGNYTRRYLTRDSDSLNAITALLRRMQKTIYPKGFLYGLPQEIFRHALIWRQNLEGGQAKVPRRRIEGGFPSWSWVAWEFNKGVRIPQHPEDLAHGNLQPPLKAISRACVNGPINCDTTHFEMSWDFLVYDREVNVAISYIRCIYASCQVQAQEIKLPTAISLSKRDRMEELEIEGFILRLPVTLAEAGENSLEGTKYEVDGKDLIPKLYLESLSLTPDPMLFTGIWHLDCEHWDIARYNEIRIRSFLLVSVEMMSNEEIRVDLILLSWEGEFAVRKGVVSAPMNWRGFEAFWMLAEPRMLHFRFR